MLIKSFGNIWTGSFQTFFRFSESYERKKAEVYQAKTQENFKADPSFLVSQNIMIDSLVPNFFTNELTLQKYKSI